MSVGSRGTYVLDTSALLTYLGNEPGSEQIHELLEGAKNQQCQLTVPFIVFMEVCYRVWQVAGEEEARRTFTDLTHLPIHRTEVDDRTLWIACEMKAVYRMSVADAWVLATAIANQAQLVHKDPDFESAKELVEMVTLPYKKHG